MSKITDRDTALARLLDSSSLARVVPQLPAETLHQLIRHRGLEACGELVTAATPAQLTTLLDLDLWRPAQPGHDGQFDVDRFGEWIEMLVDAGESVAARTVAALDTNIIVEGLSRYVRVFDPGIFEPVAQSDDELSDRHEAMREGGGGWTECEIGGYLLRARRTDAWDAIVTLLVTLEVEHHQVFHAVMQGCRALSNSNPEMSGMDDLLLASEQHLHDLSIEREQRQSQQGYATPADARAFLQMSRRPRHAQSGVNPIVAAYFRDADQVGRSSSSELAFLANVLLAGCSVQSRPFTPEEAATAAAAICKLGLGQWPTALPPDAFQIDHDLIAAFEAGWSLLHRDVSLFVAEQLISTLDDLRCSDLDIQRGLLALRRKLVEQRDTGTPWLARDAAEVLAMLDVTAWTSVLGLLDECPIIPEALTAILGGQTTPVSATAFDFISTPAQIGDVHNFMGKLPGIIGRRS